MRISAAEKFFLWIVKLGLWTIPFLPLYVSSSMLFPFITGKNFAFRIIVEVVFVLWAGLAIMREEFRPRLTPLFKAVTVFVAIVFLADLFSPNPYRAFFANYERMEGFMMIFHLYLYFIVLTSVFKTRKDWLVFFNLTLLASLFVSYIALEQRLGLRESLQGGFRVDSTIGNPTYLAAYLLFHLWLLLILIYQFWRKWWLTGIYGALLIFELAIIYFTATRGAILALVGTSVLLALALFIYWPRVFPGFSWGRKIAGAVLILSIIFPLFFWSIRDTEFVKQSPALHRLTNYSLREKTIKSRFMIWNMSWQGFLERPILGWGQENYYLVFQKYFDPGLYDQEPWFDRSHNIVFDWLIHAGILGLLAYLSIFGVVFWILYKGMQSSVIPMWTGLVLAALFISYFVQNLFVFDNLNTYFLFFGFLAFSQFLWLEPQFSAAGRRKFSREELANLIRRRGVASSVAAALAALAIVGGYFLHLKPILEGRQLIATLKMIRDSSGVTVEKVIESFKKALSYHTFGDTEVREQLGQIAREAVSVKSLSAEDKKKLVEFAVEEFRKETARPAKDSKHLLFLGDLMDSALQLNPAYAAEAEAVLKEALALSPKKQLIYFELGELYLNLGKKDKAAEALRTAWLLEPNLQRAERPTGDVWYYSILADMPELSAEIRARTKLEDLSPGVLARLGEAYRRVEKFEEALKIYEILIKADPRNPEYHAIYAALLAYFGRDEEAKIQAKEAARLDPEKYGKESEVFIKQLNPR